MATVAMVKALTIKLKARIVRKLSRLLFKPIYPLTPNNGYPTQRAINLKPGQLRILGCLMVNKGPDKAASSVSHKVVNATFP